MCGRFACLLDPEVLRRACTYKDPQSGKYKLPTWTTHPATKKYKTTYQPSANIPPTTFAPVMFKRSHQVGSESDDVLIVPMMFGLIPPWHKGTATDHGYSTINARSEGLTTSRLYNPLLVKRNLCVIVMQGFYEWRVIPGQQYKQPYLMYAPQKGNVKISDLGQWRSGKWDEKKGWTGPSITTLAGLYNIWRSPKGEFVFSFTIITTEPAPNLRFIHNRMPGILETEEQVQAWLNATTETDIKQLLRMLHPVKNVLYYPVDRKMGNPSCKAASCMEPLKPGSGGGGEAAGGTKGKSKTSKPKSKPKRSAGAGKRKGKDNNEVKKNNLNMSESESEEEYDDESSDWTESDDSDADPDYQPPKSKSLRF